MIEISEEEYAKLKAAEQAIKAIKAKKNERAKARLRRLKSISIRTDTEFKDTLKEYCIKSKTPLRQMILKGIEEFTNNEVSARKA